MVTCEMCFKQKEIRYAENHRHQHFAREFGMVESNIYLWCLILRYKIEGKLKRNFNINHLLYQYCSCTLQSPGSIFCFFLFQAILKYGCALDLMAHQICIVLHVILTFHFPFLTHVCDLVDSYIQQFAIFSEQCCAFTIYNICIVQSRFQTPGPLVCGSC